MSQFGAGGSFDHGCQSPSFGFFIPVRFNFGKSSRVGFAGDVLFFGTAFLAVPARFSNVEII